MPWPSKVLSVGQDHVGILHGGLWREPAAVFSQRHRAACQCRPHGQFADHLDLDVLDVEVLDLDFNGFSRPWGEQVMVVGCRHAAGEQQFCQSRRRGKFKVLRGRSGLFEIERLESREQFRVCHWRQGLAQRLVKRVVVGVDDPKQQYMLAGIEHLIAGDGGDSCCGYQLLGSGAGDDEATAANEIMAVNTAKGFQGRGDRVRPWVWVVPWYQSLRGRGRGGGGPKPGPKRKQPAPSGASSVCPGQLIQVGPR